MPPVIARTDAIIILELLAEMRQILISDLCSFIDLQLRISEQQLDAFQPPYGDIIGEINACLIVEDLTR